MPLQAPAMALTAVEILGSGLLELIKDPSITLNSM